MQSFELNISVITFHGNKSVESLLMHSPVRNCGGVEISRQRGLWKSWLKKRCLSSAFCQYLDVLTVSTGVRPSRGWHVNEVLSSGWKSWFGFAAQTANNFKKNCVVSHRFLERGGNVQSFRTHVQSSCSARYKFCFSLFSFSLLSFCKSPH